MGIFIGAAWMFHLFAIFGSNLCLFVISHQLLASRHGKRKMVTMAAICLALSVLLAWVLIHATISGMPDKTYYRGVAAFDLVSLNRMAWLGLISMATLALAYLLRRYPSPFQALCIASITTTNAALLLEFGAFWFTDEIFRAYGFTGHY